VRDAACVQFRLQLSHGPDLRRRGHPKADATFTAGYLSHPSAEGNRLANFTRAMMARVLLLGTVAAAATFSPAGPRFSWSTVPVFYHSCNFTGPFLPSALDVMAKFPMVTVEKGQGVDDPNDGRYAEDKIIEALRGVKQRDPNVSTIIYFNNVLDWPFYKLHEELLRQPKLWVRDSTGTPCRSSGDPSFPNHTAMRASTPRALASLTAASPTGRTAGRAATKACLQRRPPTKMAN
jgi:hypothetical protein